MLPAAARLRSAADFAAATRRGSRGGSRTVVVHLLPTDRPSHARVGFVVSKKVGSSVVRHRVTRRLRHLVRERLAELPAGLDLVVRALPASASAPSRTLAIDLSSALAAAGRRTGDEPALPAPRRVSDGGLGVQSGARTGNRHARPAEATANSTDPGADA